MRYSLAWNLATELCRRHSQFDLVDCEGGLMDRAIGLRNLQTELIEMIFELEGGLQGPLAIRPIKSPTGQYMTYENVMASGYARMIAVLEDKLQLSGQTSRVTDRKLLAYRLVGFVLQQGVVSKSQWSVTKNVITDLNDFIKRRPPHRRIRELPDVPTSWKTQLQGNLWVIRRNDKPLAVISDECLLMTSDLREPSDLMDIFESNGRSVAYTAGAAFGRLLV